jgi:hypothetical protein
MFAATLLIGPYGPCAATPAGAFQAATNAAKLAAITNQMESQTAKTKFRHDMLRISRTNFVYIMSKAAAKK